MSGISVIFEDEDIIALSKPVGVVVHHDLRHVSGTIVDWLRAERPSVVGVGEDPERPGIIHRLDKDTSGLLLVAKNQQSFLYLKGLFQSGNIRKTYLALVAGHVKNESGIIDAPIARSTKHFEKRVVGGKQGRARAAVTEYQVRERYREEYTLVEVRPKTGRTHQIRSHMAHIGHPVACDALYGGRRYQCPGTLGRQFLHAWVLEFTAPNGSGMRLAAELPPDLEGALGQLHKE